MNALLLIFVCCLTLCCIVECSKNLERHDIHRIILKPERKKNKKRSRPKTITASNNNNHFNAYPVVPHDPFVFEPYALLASAPEAFPPQNNIEHHRYANHQAEYHDLIKPKPPKADSSLLVNFPEEELAYYQPEASASNNHYVPIHHNSDWNPLPTQNNYILSNPPLNGAANSANSTKPKQKHRKKKLRRKNLSTESSAKAAALVEITTLRPTTFQGLRLRKAGRSPQSQHYVNITHDKSHVKYEVTSTKKHQQQAGEKYSPSFVDHGSNNKARTAYEVTENEERDFGVDAGPAFGPLVPVPVYPQFPPFLPTVITYMEPPKKVLDFGQKSTNKAF